MFKMSFYYNDIKLLTLELRVNNLINKMNKLTVKNDNNTVNNLIEEYIPKLVELNIRMDKVVDILKRFNDIDNKSAQDEKDVIIGLYEIMNEIGEECHKLSHKLADEVNENNCDNINKLVTGLIKMLERLYIRTRYNNIIEILK